MPPYVETLATVAALDGAETRLEVVGQEAGPDGAFLSVSSDASAGEAARPRGVQFQEAGFEIRVNDQVIDFSRFTGTISVSRSYDERLQQSSFEIILTTPTGPLGSPFATAGPPTGKKRIDVLGIYRTSTGLKRAPLITGGIADTSDRVGGEGGFTESISGVCRGGRFDRRLATLNLPPGHGLPRGRVLELLASAAGETQTRLELGNTTVKELQVVDGDWLSVAAEMQEVENRRIFWDREGYLVNPEVGRPRASEPTAWTFEEVDYLLGSKYRVRHKQDVLTDVTLTGTEQIASDAVDTGDTVKSSDKVFRAIFEPARPGYVQSTGGSYTAQAAAPAPSERIVRRIRFEQRLREGVVVYERTQTWGWKNPLAARYSYNLGAQEWQPLDAYTEDNVLGSDGAAYQAFSEEWTTLSVSEIWHYYDKAGFRRTVDPLATPEEAWLQGPYTVLTDAEGLEIHPQAGYYLGSVSQVVAYAAPRAAILSRDVTSGPPPYDAWETLEPADGTLRMGAEAIDPTPSLPWDPGIPGTVGSSARGESLLPVSRTVVNVEGDALGYKVRERTVESGWGAREVGQGAYLYGDGKERADAAESFQELAAVDVDYLPTAEGSHKKLTTRYEFGDFVESLEEPGDQTGYPPPVERVEMPERNSAVYADGEAETYAKVARRSETRQIKVQVTAPALETAHEKGVLKTSVPWAENEDELAFVGVCLIDESAAADVDFELPANFFVQPCQVIRSRYRPLGVDHDMRVRSVNWQQAVGGPLTTRVEAKLYGW